MPEERTEQALERVRRQLNGTSRTEIWPLTREGLDVAAERRDWELIADLWKTENPGIELDVREAVYAYFAKEARAMNEEQELANARLIDAAPALLEAAKEARDLLQLCFGDTPGDVDYPRRRDRQRRITGVIVELAAAIQLAEGEE